MDGLFTLKVRSSQTDKDRHYMTSFICGIFKITKFIDTENSLVVQKQGLENGQKGWEGGTDFQV